MEDLYASIFIAELLLCSLPFLSFIRSQDSIDNSALVTGIARLQLATGIRPVGRKAHNDSRDRSRFISKLGYYYIRLYHSSLMIRIKTLLNIINHNFYITFILRVILYHLYLFGNYYANYLY
jgi:hypothetical protein